MTVILKILVCIKLLFLIRLIHCSINYLKTKKERARRMAVYQYEIRKLSEELKKAAKKHKEQE